jgi:hypothetical protein
MQNMGRSPFVPPISPAVWNNGPSLVLARRNIHRLIESEPRRLNTEVSSQLLGLHLVVSSRARSG